MLSEAIITGTHEKFIMQISQQTSQSHAQKDREHYGTYSKNC